jgi:hypothetical protein
VLVLRVFRVNLLLRSPPLVPPLANLRGVVVGVCGEVLVFGVLLSLARAVEAAHLVARWALALLLVGRVLQSWVLRRKDRARRAKSRRKTHFPSA